MISFEPEAKFMRSHTISKIVLTIFWGNVILCSLLAQVVAFRYLSFGYIPKQSYLLFGAIIFNLFIIYFADKASLLLYNDDSGRRPVLKKNIIDL